MHYHPAPDPVVLFAEENDFEFLELQNVGDAPLNLQGITVSGAVSFDFSDAEIATLEREDYVVLVSDREAFESRYDTRDILIGGEYEGRLDNTGEPLRLADALGEIFLEFFYDDVWYPTTDGAGDSLVIMNAFGIAAEAWGEPESWRASFEDGGSPGEDDLGDGAKSGWQRPGDANQDGILEIGDAIRLALLLFHGNKFDAPCDGVTVGVGANKNLMDVNTDSKVDTTDVLVLLIYLFAEGPAPSLGTGCVKMAGCQRACF